MLLEVKLFLIFDSVEIYVFSFSLSVKFSSLFYKNDTEFSEFFPGPLFELTLML